MPDDQLKTIIDGIRTRLQTDLEAQLGAINATHEQALEEARRAAEAAADERWAAKLDETRLDLTARMHEAVGAARSEVERTMVAESMRVRVEAEQAAAEAASNARREMEQAVATERERLETERERLEAAAATSVRTEVERAVAAERERLEAAAATTVKTEVEQAVASERDRLEAAAAATVRTEVDQAVAAERERAQRAIELECQRAAREASELHAALDAARQDATRAAAEARTPSPAPPVASHTNGAAKVSGLLDAIRAIDNAASLSDALAATVRGAAAGAPRVVLFVVNGTRLQEWPVPGVPAVHAGTIALDAPDAGLLRDVMRRNEAMMSGDNGGPSAPAFAALPQQRRAMAVPFVLTGRSVAVLYADEGPAGDVPAEWQERVQIVARHGAACITHLTAVRTAQAMQMINGTSAATGAGTPDADAVHGARRYARLLVSEIKLYNEAAVQQGRERRDLLQRLKPEIDRARRLYDERVAPSVQARDAYFHQELVQTLADGDHSLLG
jgi:chemotaxis protein histidine kinase CheA